MDKAQYSPHVGRQAKRVVMATIRIGHAQATAQVIALGQPNCKHKVTEMALCCLTAVGSATENNFAGEMGRPSVLSRVRFSQRSFEQRLASG